MQSKLRLPGHSRLSIGGAAAGNGVRPDGTRLPRSSSGSLGGRNQSDNASTVVEAVRASLSEFAPNFAGRLEQPSSPTSPPALVTGGHIRVAVRVRPLPENEFGIIEVSGNNTVLIQKDAATGGNGYLSSQQGRIETRCFDRAFGPEATQSELYEYSCAPLLSEAVQAGRCATVFAYGATGAGKTHTMFGVPEELEKHGVILRGIPDIFRAVAEHNEEADSSEPTLQVKVSFLEIYNETVRDLLNEGGGMCRVLEDERRGVVQVSNLVEPIVASAEEALGYLEVGTQARTVEATAANSQSSRAHAVFSFTIERVWQNAPQQNFRTKFARGANTQRQLHSKISFVDLAGSERAAFTQNAGQALKDGAKINQSLLALANCIDALIAQSRLAATSTPRRKPPYRDSKLTLMLKGSLMGDGLVAMIANVHPGRLHFEDSNNTLEYAKRASMVKASNARRLSIRQSFGGIMEEKPAIAISSNGSGGDMDDDGGVEGLSLLPKPRRTVRAVRAEHLGKGLGKEVFCENTTAGGSEATASSPEECLSEISLSSGHEEVDIGSTSDPSPSSNAAPAEDRAEEVADEYRKECWEEPQQAFSEGEHVAQRDEVAPHQCPLAKQQILTHLVETLQKDNQKLDARLRLITRERNALAKDRQELEDENERLRLECIEKDRQLLLLLGQSKPVELSV